MKSKYKLKIKEISMRLKNGSILLLGIFCLFALASAVQAEPWTDPTCAAPGCNTNGPVWVSPSTAQTGYVDLTGYVKTVITDDNKNYFNAPVTSTSQQPVLDISDQRTSSITGAASLYVETALNGKPAIYGYSSSASATSYGGLFDATAAPGLKVNDGVVITPMVANPTYIAEGLLYLNSGSNQFRYYGGGAWRILNPWLTDGNELYYSLAAGTARGVAIKSGDLTGPNDAYTLDVLRVTQSTSDRALYSRLTIDAGWDYYASGFIGGYDDSGNAVGVRGKVSDHSGGSMKNYGGYFEAAGSADGTTGVYGASINVGTATTYGGYFTSASSNGYGVYSSGPKYGVFGYGSATGAITNYGGYFSTYGDSGRAVYGNASATNGLNTNYGGFFTASGGNGIGVYASGGSSGAAIAADGVIRMQDITAPGFNVSGYGQIYVNSDKLYFRDDNSNIYDLTAGGSGTIGDGTETGQMAFWNNTSGAWENTETSEMVWNNTNKNMGIGVASPTSTNKLHVVNSGKADNSTAVYGIANYTDSITNYGGYFKAAGVTGVGVYGEATGTGVSYGGYFTVMADGNTGAGLYAKSFSTGDNSYGIYSETLSTAAAIYGNNTRTTDGGVGVEGVSSAPAGGVGVIGRATNTGGGIVRGGEFYSAGSSGDALYAYATGVSGRGLYAFGYGESARFTGAEVVISNGSDSIGYATGAGDLYVGDTLEVDGSSYFANVNSSSQFLAYGSDTVSAPGYSWSGDTNMGIYRSAADTMNFATAGVSRMSISATGAVNISSTLSTVGAISTDSNMIYIDNDATSATDIIYFSNATATDESMYYNNTGDLFYFSGNIGSSTVYNATVGATNRDLYVDNTGKFGYVSSSLRYKDNVQDMEDISWLYQLRPVNFTYKNDEGKAKQYGLIAEEVEKVNPFFVSYDEEGLPETVSYSALVTPMIKAIQTQKQQLDTLETKVEMIEKNSCANNEAALMEYIEKLEARIEALEAKNAAPVKTSFWSKLW